MIDNKFANSSSQQSEEMITQFAAFAGPQKSKMPTGIFGHDMAEPEVPADAKSDAVSPFAPTIDNDEPAADERSFSPTETFLAMLKSPFTSQSDDAPFNQDRIDPSRIDPSQINPSRIDQLKPPTFFHGGSSDKESKDDDKTEIIPAPAGAVMISSARP